MLDVVPAEGRRVVGAAAIGEDANGRPILRGCRCTDCGKEMVPPVAVCPVCGGEDLAPSTQPGEGTLYSYTVVHVGPATWRRPLRLGYVDLPNGVRVFTHLEGDAFAIGDRVELDVAAIGRAPDGAELIGCVFKRK